MILGMFIAAIIAYPVIRYIKENRKPNKRR